MEIFENMRTTNAFLLLFFFSISAYSQQAIENLSFTPQQPQPIAAEDIINSKRTAQRKAPGRVFFSDDFGSGTSTSLPTGWTTQGANPSHVWIWSNAAPNGQYSTPISALNSTTNSNGFLSLPADLYNTPTPPTGFSNMDAWVSSPTFPIGVNVPSVIVEFEHCLRFCCSIAGDIVLEVSSDGVNWTAFDATSGRTTNSPSPNSELVRIDVSTALANQLSGKIRFRFTGNTHYFWMIDDVKVVEGAGNQMTVEDFEIDFHPQYAISPLYTQIPRSIAPPAFYKGMTRNNGTLAQSNVNLNVDVIMDSTYTGGQGRGVVHSASATVGASVPAGKRDTVAMNSPFFSLEQGWYRNRFYITSSTAGHNVSYSELEYSYALSDTILALDRGEAHFQGSSGPVQYGRIGRDGDAIGALMILDSSMVSSTVPVSSIYVYVANRPETAGLAISSRIWRFDQSLLPSLDSAVLNTPVHTGPQLIMPNMGSIVKGTWYRFYLFPAVYLTPGAYYFGIEQTGGGSNGKEIWLGRDRTQENIAPTYSNVMYLNDPTNPQWVHSPYIHGIRLGFNPSIITGVAQDTSKKELLEIFPNPSNGLIRVVFNQESNAIQKLTITNSNGQVVFDQDIQSKFQASIDIDLSSFSKGIYFLSSYNEKNRQTKKLVIK